MTGRAEDAGSGWAASLSATLTGERRPLGPKGREAKSASWFGEGRSGKSGTARQAVVIALCVQ